MTRFLLGFSLVFLAGCLSGNGANQPSGGTIENYSNEDATNSEEAILEGMIRWRNGIVNGDFDMYYSACSFLNRSQWLYEILAMRAAEKKGIPRFDELDSDLIVELNRWRAGNDLRFQINEPLMKLRVRMLRSEWLKNVLGDDFQSRYLDEGLSIRNAAISLKSNTANEAWFIIDMPGPSDPLLQMVLEDGIWRVEHGIRSGIR